MKSLPELVRGGPGLVTVMFHVTLSGFRRVMHGVLVMAMRRMRVVSRSFVIAALVMFRRVSMMLGGVLVVLGRLAMMRSRFLGHDSSCVSSDRKTSAGKLAGGYDCDVTAG